MLTLKQALVAATLNRLPPWKASVLGNWYPAKPLSLRSAITQLESRTAYCCLEIADGSFAANLSPATQDYNTLRTIWGASAPSKAALMALANTFKIVYLSGDWRTVVLAGTIGSFATNPNITTQAQAVSGAAVGAESTSENAKGGLEIIFGIAGTAEAAEFALSAESWPLIALGLLNVMGGTFSFTTGVLELNAATNPAPGNNYITDPNASNTINLPTVEITATTPGCTVITIPEVIIYGTPPADMTPQNVINLPTVEITDLPEEPPDPEPICPICPIIPICPGGMPICPSGIEPPPSQPPPSQPPSCPGGL